MYRKIYHPSPLLTPHPALLNTHAAYFLLTSRQDAEQLRKTISLGYGTHPGRLGQWYHQKDEASDSATVSLAGWSLSPIVCVQPQNSVARLTPSAARYLLAALKSSPKIEVCCIHTVLLMGSLGFLSDTQDSLTSHEC